MSGQTEYLDNYLVYLQASLIRKELRSLSIKGHIKVNNTPQVRDASFFAARPTLGYTNLHDIAVAIVASIGASRPSTSPSSLVAMLIPPPSKVFSGLLVDEETNALYADKFWVCEEGEFNFIHTTDPIPVDGWDVAFDPDRRDPSLLSYFETHDTLLEVTGDKNITRQVLAKAGIRVPKGILLERGENIKAKVEDFIASNAEIKGLVLKATHGSQGKQVQMYSPNEIDQLVEGMRYIPSDQFVLEERILPMDAPYNLKTSAYFDQVKNTEKMKDPENLDYNFRVITSLSTDNPVVVASEIRYAEMSNKPVNISLGAKAARLKELGDLDLTDRIHRVARAAIKAVCKEAGVGNNPMLGIGGVDLIWDSSDRISVLEVNSGLVGGFGTLCRVDQRPLGKIRDVLAPAYQLYLEKQFLQRTPTPQTLRRLYLNKGDKRSIVDFYAAAGKESEGLDYFSQVTQDFTPAEVVLIMRWLTQRMGARILLQSLEREFATRRPGDYVVSVARRELEAELDK